MLVERSPTPFASLFGCACVADPCRRNCDRATKASQRCLCASILCMATQASHNKKRAGRTPSSDPLF